MAVPDFQWDANVAAASAAGAMASSIANKGASSRWRLIGEGFASMLVGCWVGPAAADSCNLTNEHMRGAMYFATAAAGFMLLTMFLDLIKSGSFKGWIERFIPKPPQ